MYARGIRAISPGGVFPLLPFKQRLISIQTKKWPESEIRSKFDAPKNLNRSKHFKHFKHFRKHNLPTFNTLIGDWMFAAFHHM